MNTCLMARTIVRLLAASCLLATIAHAHDRSVSYSTWRLDGRTADVVLRLTRLELTHLPWWSDGDAEERFGTYAQDRLRLFAGEVPCSPNGAAQSVPSADDWLAIGWSVTCPATGELRLDSTLLLDVAPSHLHLARVAGGSGPPLELALTGGTRGPVVGGTHGGGDADASLDGWLGRGVAHALRGWDHLAFLWVLPLLGDRLGAVVQIMTAFAVGQSLTLALAALGWVHVDAPAVDALVALSIALVAAENVWLTGGRRAAIPVAATLGIAALGLTATRGHGAVPAITLGGLALVVACWFGMSVRASRPERRRWAAAIAFGLVHGFGFATVLLRADVPATRIATALFGFNAGVALAQLGVVALWWTLWRQLTRSASGRMLAIEAGSAVAACLGLFWFVSRAFG